MSYSAQWGWDLSALPVPDWKKIYGSDGQMHVTMPANWATVDIAVNAANGVGDAVDISASLAAFRNKTRTLYASGTFDGAQVTLEIAGVASPIAADWIAIPGADLITAVGVINLEFNALWIRAVIAGGTAPSITLRLL